MHSLAFFFGLCKKYHKGKTSLAYLDHFEKMTSFRGAHCSESPQQGKAQRVIRVYQDGWPPSKDNQSHRAEER